MSGVQVIEIGPDDADQRLDRWLRRNFPQISQGRIEKMCRKGELRVDGGRVKASTRIVAGQSVRVPPLPDTAAPEKLHENVTEADAAMIQAAVIFRDDHIIALNKPPGLPSQGGSKQTRHVDGLAEALRFGFEEKPRLVHRLDKDTSGILLLARTRKMAGRAYRGIPRSRDPQDLLGCSRRCPFAAYGNHSLRSGQSTGHGAKGEAEKMLCVHPRDVETTPGAKRAVTDYAVLASLANRTSWIALVPVTGRTHQLRAHMAELGHPVIGDGKYGGSGQDNLGDGWGAQLGGEISRKLHLHARSLSLTHPETGARLALTAPLPDHMARTWGTFDWHAADVPADPFEDVE